MSWFSIPLPNPFKALQFSDDEVEPDPEAQQPPNDAVSPSSGVKDDLSAIGETIGRQLRGVAAFLAPPPAEDSAGDGTSQKLAGIRNDLAEIGGSFKTSLSLLSSNRAVSEISKLASNLLQLREETELADDDRLRSDNGGDGDYEGEEEYEGAGITDEVIEFAAKISNRPELWTDFPIAFEQEFDLSDAQSEHVSIIEQLVPSLADLRSRLISDMREKQFWLIYFILLLPRLNEDDLELLSTPQIVEARETLLRMLRSKNETEVNSQNPQSDDSSNVDGRVEEMEKSQSLEKVTMPENSTASRSTEINESDAPKNVVVGTDNQSDPKVGGAERVLGSNPDVEVVKEEHENTEIWLEKDGEPRTTGSSSAPKRFQSEDDVSFSDLEDDDTDLPNRRAQSTRASSPEGSSEWVQLNKGAGIRGSQSRGQLSSRDKESEGEESSDWLTVDDFDP